MTIEDEIEYGNKYINDEKYGKYAYLIDYFISSFRDKDSLDENLFPYLYSLKDHTGKIEDWNGFYGIDKICFRYDNIFFLDESMHQIGRIFPPILDSKGEPIVNEYGEWLENTDYIESHYTEFTKISIDDFIFICHKWVELL